MIRSTNPVVMNAIRAMNADKKLAEKMFGPFRVTVYGDPRYGANSQYTSFYLTKQDKDWEEVSYGLSFSDINWTAKEIAKIPQSPRRKKLEELLAYARRGQAWVASQFPKYRL